MTLPKEIEQRIDQEAQHLTRKFKDNTDHHAGYKQGVQDGYGQGATKYATQLHALQQENADLKRRLSECEALLFPLLEYGQSKEAGFPLGSSVTEGILARAKDYERLRKALEYCASGMEHGDANLALFTRQEVAKRALTAQPEADNQQKINNE